MTRCYDCHAELAPHAPRTLSKRGNAFCVPRCAVQRGLARLGRAERASAIAALETQGSAPATVAARPAPNVAPTPVPVAARLTPEMVTTGMGAPKVDPRDLDAEIVATAPTNARTAREAAVRMTALANKLTKLERESRARIAVSTRRALTRTTEQLEADREAQDNLDLDRRAAHEAARYEERAA